MKSLCYGLLSLNLLVLAGTSACQSGSPRTVLKVDIVQCRAPDKDPPRPLSAGLMLAEAKGDLDKDGRDELVIVYDTKHEQKTGRERELYIYKGADSGWKEWHHSIGPVLPDQQGDSRGDPFRSVAVENGCIVINLAGGRQDKWNYIHRYRYQQGRWYLIGATITYLSPCTVSDEYDYNLSTGLVDIKSQRFACDDAGAEINGSRNTVMQTFSLMRDRPVLMDGFNPGNNELKIPGRRKGFYF